VHVAGFVLLLGATAVGLRAMGRPWWCQTGDPSLWSGDIWSRHNSQHLADPYTITHVMHGFALYALLWLAFRRRIGPLARATIAIGIEAGWEIVENTETMIEHYRTTTISLGYYGDSVTNSVADIVAFALGYLAATVVPTSAAIAGFFATDAALMLWIRDSLLLNVLMLVYPLEAVKNWQMGGRKQ
jgi:hypothetical protein